MVVCFHALTSSCDSKATDARAVFGTVSLKAATEFTVHAPGRVRKRPVRDPVAHSARNGAAAGQLSGRRKVRHSALGARARAPCAPKTSLTLASVVPSGRFITYSCADARRGQSRALWRRARARNEPPRARGSD